ncbi:MAG: UDP-N-acetylglucosamine 2-epimerase (non-hydrolyzing) [Candidatus Thermoplasmatota archaeon]|nr:UDP-N-acetylglucosamine 2-epimerase (non-hydrolyzing) [Candidatus Thermoplasmatota archaeon]
MIAIILGTRPEIIKMSPVIRECVRRKLDFTMIHTGQHYSYEMDETFFQQLELPRPENNLDVGSGTHAEQTAKILRGIERILVEKRPKIALVQGDTNTVMAGALAATKLHIKVGHVEAGLRSFDRSMPEEINRIVADHISDILFAPTEVSRRYLLQEGIPLERIHVVGNTIVDSVHQNLEISTKRSDILSEMGLNAGEYFLVTAHRSENVDVKERFKGIIDGLKLINDEYEMPVIYPIHPRAKKFLELFRIDTTGIHIVPPVGFLQFLQLESSARMVLTDSGGVQEETCILGTPCVTLRDNTERPETIDVGSNMLGHVRPDTIMKATRMMMDAEGGWENPFGDGRAGARIVHLCRS